MRPRRAIAPAGAACRHPAGHRVPETAADTGGL